MTKDKYLLIDKLKIEGKSWDDMKEYGVSDTDRKRYYGYLDGLRSQSEDILIEEKLKVKQLKKELSIERQMSNENVKYITEHRMLREQRRINPNIKLEFDRVDYPSHNNFYIVTTTDFHYNGDVSTLNRLNAVRNEIIRVIEDNNLDELVLVELGDVIEGASLRTSQLMGIKSGMVNQTLQIAHAYKQMIESIIEETNVDLTMISVTSSNHTQLRTLGTKRNELPDEDLMLVFNDVIKQSEGLYKFIEGDEICVDIYNYSFYFAHGHTVRNKEGHLEKVGGRLNKRIDFGFFGHYHHQRSIDLYKRVVDNRVYDMRVFYVPALYNVESQYEKDLNVSSCSGIGVYKFNDVNGNISSGKVVIE